MCVILSLLKFALFEKINMIKLFEIKIGLDNEMYSHVNHFLHDLTSVSAHSREKLRSAIEITKSSP